MRRQSRSYSAIFCRFSHSPKVVRDLQRFRKRLFIDRLGWKLRIAEGRERDQFDTEDACHCALYADTDIVGGFRALRTDGDYLVREVFPDLATFRPYPSRADVWEISRFGILARHDQVFLGSLLYSLMFRFAFSRGASALVALADLTYERYLTRIGIRTRRYGPPQVIGTNRRGRPLLGVVGEIPLAEQRGARFDQLLTLSRALDVRDETSVQGSDRISA